MNTFTKTSELLNQVVPKYIIQPEDERGLFFAGLLCKVAASIDAIIQIRSLGAIWPPHGRWLIEAFAIASRLHEDDKVIGEIKRKGLKTFLLVSDLSDFERKKIESALPPSYLPSVETILNNFEKQSEVSDPGLLYKFYRLLSEYSHFEFDRTCSYPRMGSEPSTETTRRCEVFENIICACALSIPAFSHCPPKSGYSDEVFEEIMKISELGWKNIRDSTAEQDTGSNSV